MSCSKYLFTLFAVMMTALPAQADDVQQRIFEDNLKRAEAGDANSQFIVAHRYEIGVGTEKNIEKAFEWYNKAAQQGHPLAKLKTEARNEEADKEARARHDSEQAHRAEQQARAEAEAHNKAQQAEAARKRKAAETTKLAAMEAKPVAVSQAKPEAVSQAKPVAVSQAKTEAVSETPVNAMDVVLGNLWLHNQTSAEILPSPNTSCLRTAAMEITCFTGESQQTAGATRLSYTVKSVLTRFAKDGSFQVQYVYNVTDLNKAATNAAAGSRSLSEIKPSLGWQEPGYTAACRASTDRNIECVTDRKTVVQFSKM
jgi:hypothetical protein